MTVRAATVSDFLEIAALDRTGWGDNRNAQFVPDGEHVWRIWCEHAIVGVAEISSRIAGVVLAFPCTDGSYCLHKIVVGSEHRGRGLGMKLMGYITDYADTHNLTLFLTVDPENLKALALYRESGFAESRLVRGYYREPEDRYVMTRQPRGAR